jgi:hypothetical protein
MSRKANLYHRGLRVSRRRFVVMLAYGSWDIVSAALSYRVFWIYVSPVFDHSSNGLNRF